jgi:hypothetical protein
MSFFDLAELEALSISVITTSADHAEGIAAFLGKRQPRFLGH